MTATPSNTNRILIILVVTNLLVSALVLFRSSNRAGSVSLDCNSTNSPASLDPSLVQQANSLVKRIVAISHVTEKNVVEAAQLWSEAQLTLEAAVLSGETPEFIALGAATTNLQKSLVPSSLVSCNPHTRMHERRKPCETA